MTNQNMYTALKDVESHMSALSEKKTDTDANQIMGDDEIAKRTREIIRAAPIRRNTPNERRKKNPPRVILYLRIPEEMDQTIEELTERTGKSRQDLCYEILSKSINKMYLSC